MQTDFEINRLIEKLKALKTETLVVFHSDNGATPHGCNFPYKALLKI